MNDQDSSEKPTYRETRIKLGIQSFSPSLADLSVAWCVLKFTKPAFTFDIELFIEAIINLVDPVLLISHMIRSELK